MVLKEIFGKKEAPEAEEDIDIENYLNDLSIRDGKIIEREDVIYVKPVELDGEGKGVGTAIKELEKGNIVLLNIKKRPRQPDAPPKHRKRTLRHRRRPKRRHRTPVL